MQRLIHIQICLQFSSCKQIGWFALEKFGRQSQRIPQNQPWRKQISQYVCIMKRTALKIWLFSIPKLYVGKRQYSNLGTLCWKNVSFPICVTLWKHKQTFLHSVSCFRKMNCWHAYLYQCSCYFPCNTTKDCFKLF